MIKCPACGAELQYDIGDDVVKCLYCDSVFNPKELEAKVTTARELNDKISAETYLCQSCGARLLTFDDTAATFCDYCGSENMLKDKLIELNKPDFVIPFKITKEECIKIYNKKIGNSFFAPDYLKNNVVLEKIRGIYMPYCIYYYFYDDNARFSGKKYWKHSGNYDYYIDYLLDFHVKSNVDGLSYELVSRFYDRYSKAINPFYLQGSEEFNINYMSGFYVDSYDVKKESYVFEAGQIASSFSEKELKKKSIFRAYGCTSPRINYVLKDSKIGMFPVYFLAFRDEKREKISYAIINGQTGKIAADVPVDIKKYIIAVLLLTIPIFILNNIYLNLNFGNLLFWSMFFNFVVSIIIKSQENKLETRDFNDIGLNKKNRRRKKLKSSSKPFLFLLLPVVVFIINPINDIYYYVTCLILFIVDMYYIIDIIKKHNLLTTRNIPQLEKRGGNK